MTRTIRFAALAALALPLLATPARAADPVDAAAVWSKKCASCHGEDGKAQTKMGLKHKIEDMASDAVQKKHSDADFKEAITNGVKDTKMNAFKEKLSADEIDALVKFVRAFKKG